MNWEISFLFDSHEKYLYSDLARIAPMTYFWFFRIESCASHLGYPYLDCLFLNRLMFFYMHYVFEMLTDGDSHSLCLHQEILKIIALQTN